MLNVVQRTKRKKTALYIPRCQQVKGHYEWVNNYKPNPIILEGLTTRVSLVIYAGPLFFLVVIGNLTDSVFKQKK